MWRNNLKKKKKGYRLFSIMVDNSYTPSSEVASTLADLTGSLMQFTQTFPPIEVRDLGVLVVIDDNSGSSSSRGGGGSTYCFEVKILVKNINWVHPGFWVESKGITCFERSNFFLGDPTSLLFGSSGFTYYKRSSCLYFRGIVFLFLWSEWGFLWEGVIEPDLLYLQSIYHSSFWWGQPWWSLCIWSTSKEERSALVNYMCSYH